MIFRMRVKRERRLSGKRRGRPPFLGILSAASGLIGPGLSFLSGKKQAKAQGKAAGAKTQLVLDAYNDLLQMLEGPGGTFEKQQAILEKIIGQVEAGSAKSTAAILSIGDASRRRALEREQQLGAQSEQSLISRGLGSSTVATESRRGIASDTSRILQEIDEGVAALQASAINAQTASVASAYGGLANFYGGKTAALATVAAGKASAATAAPIQPLGAAPDYSGIGTALGDIGQGVFDWWKGGSGAVKG